MRRPGYRRRRLWAWLAATLALLAACGAIPMRPRGGWIAGTTPRFELASGLSEARTREIAAKLLRLEGVARTFGELDAPAPSVPTQVVLFPRARNFAALRPHRGLSGYFLPAAHASFLAIDAADPAAGFQVAQHELVHLLQQGSAGAASPAWYREGLADLLATARFDGEEAEIGAAPPGHQELARLAPLPLARVLGANDVLRWDARALGAFYAQSWALAHTLLLGERAPPRPSLRDFVARLASGADPDAACREALGRPLEQLERDVLAHVERDALPTVRVPAPSLGTAERSLALAPLADADRDALLGDLAFALGERYWRRAESFLRAALASRPDHALALATSAWLSAERGEPEAQAGIASAEALRTRDPEVARRIGEAWLALARDPPAATSQAGLVGRAEASFARSLALAPAHPAAQLGLARIAGARGEAERARRELAAARLALPTLPALDLELADDRLAADDAGGARSALAPLLANPHAAPTQPRERETLARLLREAGLDREGDLATRHLAARLDVQAPAPGELAVTDLPFLEVRGKAGLWEAALQDVAIALDVSNSTLDASGVDVDGDGRVGRTLGRALGPFAPPSDRGGSSDRGDSIVRAEIAAAERLLAELDPATTRVSLVLFTAEARLAAPLGALAVALAALRRHRVHFDPTGTSFAAALERALEDLIERRRPGERSQRTILMLSDGEPTAPSRVGARSEALRAADELARHGVRVHGFAIGKDALEKSDTLREVAERTGGRFAAVDDLSDVSFLREVRLTGLDTVAIRNAHSGENARALRAFADGSFDGIVALAPGDNTIEVRAEVAGREPLVVTRRVRRVPPAPGDATHAARVRALREAVAQRTEQIAARAQLASARARREPARAAAERRVVEITPIATADVAAPPPEPPRE